MTQHVVTRRGAAGVGAGLACLALAAFVLPAAAQERVPVVATFSILGDLVHQVGGDRVNVDLLVGPNGDAHVFAPSPSDARKVARAKAVFTNGLGLEGWLDRLIKASGTKAPVVTVSQGVAAMDGEEEHDKPARGKATTTAHRHEKLDPHAWQDIGNAKIYVQNIRDALIAADPAGKSVYERNAGAYVAELDKLEGEVKAAIAVIPPERRRIITTHDAFGYFAKAYGMEFIAPQGVSTETEASARDVGRIIQQIRKEKVPAVFLENVTDPRLIQRIAKESGAKIGGKVFSDALSEPGGPAATYVDMIRNNIRAFSAALTS
jgi:zinc/manganese transport system substrate-binding protein